jgi:DNA-binding transcriptional LysR family regulator
LNTSELDRKSHSCHSIPTLSDRSEVVWDAVFRRCLRSKRSFARPAPSFRAAAQQLALSPSAFSRCLQTLEAFTGAALFDRSAPPELTGAGRQYCRAIAGRLDEVLAANWLMPRFSRFLKRNPDIDVDIIIGQDLNLVRSL